MANDYDKLKKQLIEYYQDLLIVQYHDKPKAKAMIKAEMEETLANLLDIQVRDAFDVDTAVGVQLDIIGKWVGVDRIFKGQMFDNQAWFSLTRYNEPTTPLQGGFSRFDNFDTLEGGFLTYDFIIATKSKINDTDFRLLIKLKIIRNNIKHSPKDIDEAMYKLFADTLYTVWNEMVYNSDAFTVIGNPTITDEGVASGFTGKYSTENISTLESIDTTNVDNMRIEYCFTITKEFTAGQMFLVNYASTAINGKPNVQLYGARKAIFENIFNSVYTSYSVGDDFKVVYDLQTTKASTYTLYKNGLKVDEKSKAYIEWKQNNPIFLYGNYSGDGAVSINLSKFSITVDGKEVLSGSKSQPMEMTFYYKKKNYGIVKLGQEKNCFPIPTGVKANFVEVK